VPRVQFTKFHGIYIEALCAAPPEALAHSPSQMPLSCPVAPASQLELHKDGGGGGGGGVVRRARAARAPKAKSCTTSSATSYKTSRAASFTCSPFTCRPPLPLGLQHQQQVSSLKRVLNATTTPQTQTRPNRLHTHTHPPKRLAHPRSPIPHLSTLTSRATHAHPTSPRSTGFCAIWDCISSSSIWDGAAA